MQGISSIDFFYRMDPGTVYSCTITDYCKRGRIDTVRRN